MVTYDTYITATQVCELIEKIADLGLIIIYECLNDAHLKHKKELDSLLTLRFQKFNKSQIMNV